MKDCKDCIHDGVCYLQEICVDIKIQLQEFGCNDFKNKSRFVELPCQVGDYCYTVEWYDKEFRVMEHKFYSVIDILQKQEGFGKYYFLTYDEAKQEADKHNGM